MTLVEIARKAYPRQYFCRCGLNVRLVSGVWRDGAGEVGCHDNYPHRGELRGAA